jgi:hypothetical protein
MIPMYKRLVAVALILVFVFVSPAAAITDGTMDGDNHPYVGLVRFYDEGGDYLWRCSGTLISETVFLTAGHCTAPDPVLGTPVLAKVWFDSDLSDPIYPNTYVTGTPNTHPKFCIGCAPGLPGFDSYDVGIVVLSQPVTGKGSGVLPELGFVDALAMKTEVTVIGYGVHVRTTGKPSNPPPGNPHPWNPDPRIRMYATSQLIQSRDKISGMFVKLTQNPSQGKGGTCFGDSGGPVLLDNTVLAVTSFGSNYNCAGVGYYYRIDTADAQDFINTCLDGDCSTP